MASFGVSDSLEYFELSFDSLDTQKAATQAYAPTDWPLFNLGRPLTNIAGIKITQVEIPFSWYVFNSKNNTFLLNVAGACTNALVTIPVGNYNSTTLITALTTALNTALYSQGFGGTLMWSVTFSGASSVPNTGKFTFVLNSLVSTATSFTFGDSSDTGNTNPRLFLGFGPGVNTATFVSGTGMVLTAPNANLLSGPNYLYLNSRKLGQLCNMFLPTGARNLGSGNNGPQMAKIPVNVQSNGIIYWQDPDPEKYFDLEDLFNVADLDFYFTLGNSSNVVAFNGLSFSIKLVVITNKAVSSNLVGGTHLQNRVHTRFNVR
jgi:hypothetical protein